MKLFLQLCWAFLVACYFEIRVILRTGTIFSVSPWCLCIPQHLSVSEVPPSSTHPSPRPHRFHHPRCRFRDENTIMRKKKRDFEQVGDEDMDRHFCVGVDLRRVASTVGQRAIGCRHERSRAMVCRSLRRPGLYYRGRRATAVVGGGLLPQFVTVGGGGVTAMCFSVADMLRQVVTSCFCRVVLVRCFTRYLFLLLCFVAVLCYRRVLPPCATAYLCVMCYRRVFIAVFFGDVVPPCVAVMPYHAGRVTTWYHRSVTMRCVTAWCYRVFSPPVFFSRAVFMTVRGGLFLRGDSTVTYRAVLPRCNAAVWYRQGLPLCAV